MKESPVDRLKKLYTGLYKIPFSAKLGLFILLLVIFMGLFGFLIVPHDPFTQNIAFRLSPPLSIIAEKQHIFGTDPLGRDILSRIILGARVSLIIALVSVLCAGTFGTIVGIMSGFYRGLFDIVISRIIDIQLAIPFMVLAVAIAAMLGPGLINVVIVLTVTAWARYARLVRAQTLSIRENEFIESARAIGAGDFRIMFYHIAPNVLNTVIVISALEVARIILAEAALSFLGLSVKPGTITWGAMIADGRDYLERAWWVSTIPGLAILITVLGFNLLGDWIRDRLDPTLRIR